MIPAENAAGNGNPAVADEPPKARTIHVSEDLFKDRDLYAAERETRTDARLVYLTIWAHCDDDNTFEWNAARLSLIPMLRGVDVMAALLALESHGLLERFDRSGKQRGAFTQPKAGILFASGPEAA